MGEQEIDSQLKEMLDLLRPVPRRGPDAMRRSRSRFYADLDVYFPVEAAYNGPVKTPSLKPAVTGGRYQPWFYRPAITYLAIVIFVLVVLFGGGIATASAAGNALPGDALYPVKLDLEQARLALTTNRVRKAELHLEFAQRRMGEINALAELGEFERVAPLAKQFNHQLSLALGAAEDLQNLEPGEAQHLQEQVTQVLNNFQGTINLVITHAPPALVPGLQSTFENATQVTPQSENSGNPNSNGSNGPSNNNSNGNPNPGGVNPNANPNAGNANNNGNPAQPNANSNASPNAHSNSNGAPGSVITGNGNDNSGANPNSNKDKTKENNGKGKGKDKEKDNNGKKP
jgi:Domain of unknown function (DUF5667)